MRNLFINVSLCLTPFLPASPSFLLFPEKFFACALRRRLSCKGTVHFWSRPWSCLSRWVHFQVSLAQSPATSKLYLVLGKFSLQTDRLSVYEAKSCRGRRGLRARSHSFYLRCSLRCTQTWLELRLCPKCTISVYGASVPFQARMRVDGELNWTVTCSTCKVINSSKPHLPFGHLLTCYCL